MSHDKKMLDREAVRSVIQQWNANRLDLFALSEPDEVSPRAFDAGQLTKFHFFHAESALPWRDALLFSRCRTEGGHQMHSRRQRCHSHRCHRSVARHLLSSTSTSYSNSNSNFRFADTLIEKFRPDMRMLSVPNYALYEVHANGEERRLNADEKPLLVQLNWHIDDREGRFLLKNIDQKTTVSSVYSFK